MGDEGSESVGVDMAVVMYDLEWRDHHDPAGSSTETGGNPAALSGLPVSVRLSRFPDTDPLDESSGLNVCPSTETEKAQLHARPQYLNLQTGHPCVISHLVQI